MIATRIRDLYHKDRLSSRQVAQKLGISQWSVISLMRRYNIPRRTFSEANQLLFSKKSLSYRKKPNITKDERFLLQAALMLYWAEGYKKGVHSVDLSNSDERIIVIFLKALRRIYRVEEKKLRVYLYCYSNQGIHALLEYWSKILEIPKSQFIKPYVRKDFDEKKKNVMPHGLVHIRYYDKKLLQQIKAEIDIIYNEFQKLGWLSGQKHFSVKEASERAT